MIQWEYKTEYGVLYMDDETLNKIGVEGWELVSFMFRYESAARLSHYNYIFKRQITENK